MDLNTLSIIKNQTGITDEEHIKNIYKQKNNSIIDTIVHLSDLKEDTSRKENNESKPSIFVEIRKIIEEKENIYHNRNKGI